MKIPSFSGMFKGGGAGKAGKADDVVDIGGKAGKAGDKAEDVKDPMKNYVAAAKAGKYGVMATSIGMRFLEKNQGEANFMERPTEATGRPPGDNRSAEEIIDANPALKNLGNQKDIKKDLLKERCGDWENEPDPQKRADAAYNMSKVLNYIDCSANREGGERENAGDGDIQGITKDGDARHGTEAGMLKDFAEQGYGHLPENRQLDKTKDTHVRMDGSNKDNFQWGMGEMGKIFSKIPILSSVVAPFFEAVGEGRGLGDTIGKAFKGLAESGFNAITTFAGGPASIAKTAAMDTVQIVGEEIYDAASGKEKDHDGGIFT